MITNFFYESIKFSAPDETVICQINITETQASKTTPCLTLDRKINELGDIKAYSQEYKDKLQKNKRKSSSTKNINEVRFLDM